MKVVADTNIFLAVALNESHKDKIVELSTGCDVYASDVLPYEIGNALSAIVKHRQITAASVCALSLSCPILSLDSRLKNVAKLLSIRILE